MRVFPDNASSIGSVGLVNSLMIGTLALEDTQSGTQVVDGFSTKNLKAWYYNQGGGRQ